MRTFKTWDEKKALLLLKLIMNEISYEYVSLFKYIFDPNN